MLRERLLDILFREDVTQKELTSRTKGSRSRVSEILGKLEEEGLIRRRRIGKRTVVVSLNHSNTLRVGILKSSEYAYVLFALDKIRKEIPFKVTVYNNSLEALKGLMTGSEDIVASPLISGYFFHLIDKQIKPVSGIAKGGSGILKRRDRGKIGTTPLSRMDRDSREFRNYKQVYFNSVEEMLRSYKKGEIDAVQLWEPFVSMNGGIKNNPSGTCCCLFTHSKETRSIRIFLGTYSKLVSRPLTVKEKRNVSKMMHKILGVGEKGIFESLDSYIFTSLISREDVGRQVSAFGLPLGKEVDSFLERASEVSL